MFFILCLVFPWITGTLLLPDKEQSFTAAAYRIVGGNTGMWAVFQLLAVPAVLLQLPFHTLVRLWLGALLLLLGLFAFFCRDADFRSRAFFTQKEMAPSSAGGGKIKSSQEESALLLSKPPADARAAQGKFVSRADAQPGTSPAEPDLNGKMRASDRRESGRTSGSTRVTVCLLILASLILIGGQCRKYLFEEHIDDDDSRFIASAVSACQHDTMLLENPATGEEKPRPEGELVKDVASPWPMYLAAVSTLTGVHPAITAHTVLPAYFLLLRYLVIWCAGAVLFAGGESGKTPASAAEKQAWFLLFSAAALQYFGGSVHTAGAFALTRIWQGKAVMAAVMIPWILLLTYGRDRTGEVFSPKVLFAAAAAACLLSGMGILMAGALIGSYALWRALRSRNAAAAVPPALCALPCLLYGLVYMVLR